MDSSRRGGLGHSIHPFHMVCQVVRRIWRWTRWGFPELWRHACFRSAGWRPCPCAVCRHWEMTCLLFFLLSRWTNWWWQYICIYIYMWYCGCFDLVVFFDCGFLKTIRSRSLVRQLPYLKLKSILGFSYVNEGWRYTNTVCSQEVKYLFLPIITSPHHRHSQNVCDKNNAATTHRTNYMTLVMVVIRRKQVIVVVDESAGVCMWCVLFVLHEYFKVVKQSKSSLKMKLLLTSSCLNCWFTMLQEAKCFVGGFLRVFSV